MLALAILDKWSQDHDPAAIGLLHDGVYDLLCCLLVDLTSTLRAMWLPYAGVKQAQIVVYLGHRANCRAWVAAGPLLVNGDGRAQPFDLVHVGLVHLAQKLPGIGRQRLHVATLPLGVDSVKSQA